ncbi:MAG TPA: ribonuclease III [Candidatus Lachnoclostridium stercorigallinarum]|uniref:Mini-ribonuclease 3 n=1 Tax=Candidatus Lachnoclostridium stercorigallinarum TaxID=2838634 RepID=A0A9D2GI31_9FIRM|nr:ribonuclease III [Candidatus Lachnoclostridium stercorigallinarum]
MEESIISRCREFLELEERDPNGYSPLVLAYIGDGVYELVIRTKVVNRGNTQVNKMHKVTSGLVKAQTQAQMYLLLEEELTEEERAVYRRGRNAKSATMAKHATMRDYRMATGFEALMGWLYLSGRLDRLTELVSLGLKKMGEIQ